VPWSQSFFGISEAKDHYSHDNYFASNSYVDYEIGRVIDKIKKDFGDDTIIIYTSDHGEMHGAHRLKSKGPTAFEEITNVPFIVSGPENLVGKGENKTVVSHLDIMPTMMDYAGIKITDNMSGGSIRNNIESNKSEKDRQVFIEYMRYETGHDGFGAFQPYRCIVKGNWKLTIHLESTDELYNIAEDPEEMNNRIEDEKTESIRNKLFVELMNHMYTSRDSFRGSHWYNRTWRKSDVNDWTGPERPKPDDGTGLIFYDYNNGAPMKGVTERV